MFLIGRMEYDRDVGQSAEGAARIDRIEEIDRHVGGAGFEIRRATEKGDDLPILAGGQVIDQIAADDAEAAGNDGALAAARC